VHQNDRTATARLPQLGLDAARPDATRPAGLTLVMGAGLIAAETVAELVARQMKFVVCARRVERAALLARRPDQVVAFEELPAMLDRVEVVVCATGARTPLLSVADISDAMARREGKPLVIVDLSLPRNVDPAAGRLPGVRLLDLEDLVSGSSLVEVRRRTDVVDDEFRRFESWMAGQIASRMIASLHSTVRRLCRDALEASLAEVGLTPSAIAAASHRIAGRLLHAPTSTIKALMADGDEAAARQILTSFGIPGWSDDIDDPAGVDAAQQHLQVIASARSVRLVTRSGRRCGELGRVRLRPGSVAEIAS
jgi:glutamyl-tRNA reductase